MTSADDAPRDTRIERSSRQSLDLMNIGFDLIALPLARDAIAKLQPDARVEVFKSSARMSMDEQRAIAEVRAAPNCPTG